MGRDRITNGGRRLALIGLLAALGMGAAAPASAHGAGLTASFSKSSDWGSGFIGHYVIRNAGSAPVEGWRLAVDLPSGAAITSAWSASLSSSGSHYVLGDEPWTHTIAPGASVTIGFQAVEASSAAEPHGCVINGAPCDGDTPPPPPPDTTPPSAPAGLAASDTTTTGATLSWRPSSDDVGVSGYSVYRDGAKVAGTTATATAVTGLQPGASYRFSVRARDAAGNVSPASAPVEVTTLGAGGGGTGSTASVTAPYVDMTLYPRFALGDAARDSGVDDYTLAFIVSGAPCQAAWGGVTPLDDPFITGSVADLRAAGGHAIISFGGAANQELALTCTSVDSLRAQYESVIDAYGIRDLDFDIEGAAQRDSASLQRRAGALAQIQAAGRASGRPVRVSFTLPVMPTGLTSDGLDVLRTAIAAGVDVSVVNVMAMDYYDPALAYDGRMGDYAIQAATSTHAQLAQLYPARSDAELWQMVGVTPMIGINDDPNEVFTLADARQLAAFAARVGAGRLAMWSANRDAPCPAPQRTTSNTCSGVDAPRWAFADALAVGTDG